MKKFLCTLLAAAMCFSLSVPAFAQDTATQPEAAPFFKDVDTTTDQGMAIVKMYQKGYLAGYEDGTFRPDGHITRAELVRVINQVMDYNLNTAADTQDFKDNANQANWYYKDVRIAQQMGYISGFGDNSFRPKENFTRQQACVVLTLITNVPHNLETQVEVADEVSPWAKTYVNSALIAGIFKLEEGRTFRATQNITRGELCLALSPFVTEQEAKATTETTQAADESTEATTEAASQATTKASVSYTGGGGGGGGTKVTTTTTQATTTAQGSTQVTTEATTEATTKAPAGSNNNKKPSTTTTTTTTTEATTEITTAQVEVDAALITSIKYTVRNITRYVIPKCSTQAEKDVAQAIVNSMESFLADYSYDVTDDANAAMAMYKSLSESEKSELKNLIMANCSASDLIKLQETFFPGLAY